MKKMSLKPMNDVPTTAKDLVEQFQEGIMAIPSHQRKTDAWKKDKKMLWIERVRSGNLGVGCILTYQIRNGDGTTYLNDGLQRMAAIIEYFEHPEKHGDKKEVAIDNLRSFQLTVQHRHYDSHDEALLDFQTINQGSSLTAYEFCHGILTYMPNYDLFWKDVLDTLHFHIEKSANGMISSQRGGRKKEQIHVYRRHDLQLFYRYAIKNKEINRYWTAKKEVRIQDVTEKNVIEWLVRDLFEEKGIDEIRNTLKTFLAFVDSETALIEELWRKQEPDVNLGISMSLYRTLIDIAIWKKNNAKPHVIWEDFVKKMLQNSGGNGFICDPNNPRKKAQCGMEALNSLKTFCDIIESDLYQGKYVEKSKISNMKPGRDNSHVDPKSIYGEGKTFAEPAGRNRARGARQSAQPMLAADGATRAEN